MEKLIEKIMEIEPSKELYSHELLKNVWQQRCWMKGQLMKLDKKELNKIYKLVK